MIKCADCKHCRSLSIDKEVYKMNCDINGKNEIAVDYTDSFNCDDFSMKDPMQEPIKDNVMIVLNSGRDYCIFDKNINSISDLRKKIRREEYVMIGDLEFRTSQIAVYAYIGD